MRAGVVYLAAALLGFAGVANAELPIACKGGGAETDRPLNDVHLDGLLPKDDYVDIEWNCVHMMPNPTGGMARPMIASPRPPTPSQWIQADKSAHVLALAKSTADILVVPFQVQGFGIDRAERAIMTADLAYELSQSASVADPFLVARALGEGGRRLLDIDIRPLARQLKARYIVTTYVGHENRNALTVSMQIVEYNGDKIASQKRKDWKALPFTNEDPPFLAFHRILPDIVREIAAINPGKAASSVPEQKEFATIIKKSPIALVKESSRDISAVQTAILLAAMAPPSAESASERLNVRAYLAALRSRSTSDQTRFIQAYALMNLSHRPAALELLKGMKGPRDLALIALLNGNLPAAENARARIKNDFEKLLIDVGLQDLRQAYGREKDLDIEYLQNVFATNAEAWRSIVAARIVDADSWSNQSAMEVKTLLDRSFQVDQFDNKNRLQGGAVLANDGAFDEVEIDIASARHIRYVIEHRMLAPCCESIPGPSTADMLTLIEGQLEARITKEFHRSTALKGLPDQTMAEVYRYMPYFDGHPLLEEAKAVAAYEIYKKAPNDTRSYWQRLARSAGLNAAMNSHGQNRISASGLASLGPPPNDSMDLVDAYGYDYPRRAYWIPWFIGVDLNKALAMKHLYEQVAYSRMTVEPFEYLTRIAPPAEHARIESLAVDRFVGYPNRASYFHADTALQKDRVKALRAAITADPGAWENYSELGRQLCSDGNFKEASQVFNSYPGFKKDSKENRVTLSNHAFDAGTLFYSKGKIEYAAPLYKIAADQQSGSAASMTSEVRLSILARDYVGATQKSIARAKRYDDAYAYRDYLSFLHAFGEGKEAWPAFTQIAGSFEAPGAWTSALVGHRKDGADEGTIRKWLTTPFVRNAAYRERKTASWYAILTNSVDRIPPEDLHKLVAELDGEPKGRIERDGVSQIVPYTYDRTGFQTLAPSTLRAGKTPKLNEDTSVKSDLAYFAEGYALLMHGQYGKSADAFAAMADRFPIETQFSFVLGYFAYAASKSGNAYGLEQFIEANFQKENFDYWLAKAIFSGARKDVNAAYDAIGKAFLVMPSTGYRPIFTDYQYAETCEWLFKQTNDKRFAQALLTWVKQYQSMQPTHAWAYAMQYTYESEPDAQLRALAMTIYLDRLSPRIAKANAADLAKAQVWLKDHNPFRLDASKPSFQAAL